MLTRPRRIRAPWAPLIAIPLALAAAASGPASAADEPARKPFVVECYYKARWGHAEEFLALFRKNHHPVLAKLVEKGDVLGVTMVKPRYHGTEDGRWDFKVTIVFKDVQAAHAPASEADAIKQQLFPDQAAYKAEERRRFEILEAHWDVPVEDVSLP